MKKQQRQQVTKHNEQEFSKFLSFILRHEPQEIGISLMEDAWVSTEELLNAINNHVNSNWIIDMNMIEEVVANDKKQRYSFNSDKTLIRANQGHSIKDLIMNFKEVETPPKYLYHGTSAENAKDILSSGGLKPMSRQYVHLSDNYETAVNVGKRHGKPVVFQIETDKAIEDGIKFYISDNGVYLTKELSTEYMILEVSLG